MHVGASRRFGAGDRQLQQRLSGIFTGRDAVRTPGEGKDAAKAPLAQAMTPNPVTITPESPAIDALRAISDGGFRHLLDCLHSQQVIRYWRVLRSLRLPLNSRAVSAKNRP